MPRRVHDQQSFADLEYQEQGVIPCTFSRCFSAITDASLLSDSVRVITRLVGRLGEMFPKLSQGFVDHPLSGRVQRADQRLSDYFVVEGASPCGVLMAKRFLLS